jgi:DEAD/DEAH box helicase domain-containing protein
VVGTLVTGTAHDLYFFADPREMLQGQVNPPGCYLDAAEILRRQLLAYSLDRWVLSGIDQEALPRQLKAALDAVEQSGASGIKQAFPYTWLSWCEAHQGELLERFLGLFDQVLAEASRQELRRVFLNSEDMPFSAPYAQELLQRRVAAHDAACPAQALSTRIVEDCFHQ